MRLPALLAQARNFFLLFFMIGTLSAQEGWPTYGGDPGGQRFSNS